MQRQTKYRVIFAALALVSTVSAGYAFVAGWDAKDLRAEASAARRSAAESVSKAASAADKVARLEQQLREGTAERSKTATVIAAFSTQATACEAVKQQLHAKGKSDDRS